MKDCDRVTGDTVQGLKRHRQAPTATLILLTAVLVTAICAVATPARSTVLSGSLRTSVYTEKSRLGSSDFMRTDSLTGLPADSLENRTRLLETLRLDALALGRRELSFHTAFTASNILTHQSIKETRTRFYRGYLQGAGKSGGISYDARLGRQWVLAGVGSGIVDGASLRLDRTNMAEISGFFGTLGPDQLGRSRQFWNLESPSDSRSFGGRLRLHHSFARVEPVLAVSFAQDQRKPHADLITDAQRVGVQAELRVDHAADSTRALLRGARAYGEMRRDLIYGRNTHTTGGLELYSGVHGGRAWVEYARRQPDFRVSSFFASFDSRPVNAVRGGIGAAVAREVQVNVDGDLVSFDGNESEKGVRVSLSAYGATVGYRLHNGYGGDLSGLIFYGHRDLGEKLTLDASVDLTQYKYGDVKGEDNLTGVDDSESTGILAAGYRLLPSLTLTGQVEGLRNPRFNHDVRFLGMIHWRFRTVV